MANMALSLDMLESVLIRKYFGPSTRELTRTTTTAAAVSSASATGTAAGMGSSVLGAEAASLSARNVAPGQLRFLSMFEPSPKRSDPVIGGMLAKGPDAR
mmetsp:Transcript_9317/g.23076  ORF Transcript_9317/g.23076 Transcript_9317/m.23076 type:complete len:100 (-) Transcript_9317:854-1153(-)|eukprot:CAMPEP_0202867104 /NCGR_PEP_ID=MMETSP1391-20130828/8704_1 /ASSEMBLY_ACC=CAM_ASM_000867 /TAXON_ID=1034604 /ORGANISM="Chlamydomonas leiostraca, Strain SAG 11-49" /LENGTH=99 /DNA_ID=CAMNT_0049547113 /DNA_START=116 /DNA_END=415 /DNA_ORIENTATION=+